MVMCTWVFHSSLTSSLLRSRGLQGLCILNAEDPPHSYTISHFHLFPAASVKLSFLRLVRYRSQATLISLCHVCHVANPQSCCGICAPGRDHRCRWFRDGLNPCISRKPNECWQWKAWELVTQHHKSSHAGIKTEPQFNSNGGSEWLKLQIAWFYCEMARRGWQLFNKHEMLAIDRGATPASKLVAKC